MGPVVRKPQAILKPKYSGSFLRPVLLLDNSARNGVIN